MKEYEDYFRTKEHIETDNPETFVWTQINSTGLAEIMELAEQHGYTYKLEYFDEPFYFKDEVFMHHTRNMVFIKDNLTNK